ncbi:MAG: hypothetical protein RIC95_12835 [Vicingaceae bacterium]
MKPLLFIFALLISGFSQAQEAKAILKDQSIRIGEQTTIDLEVRFQAGSSIMMPALRDTISKFVEIVKVSNVDTTFDEDDITIKIFTQKLTVTSWDSGYHPIPPFVFQVNEDTVRSKPLLLEVKSIPLEAQADIKDIKSVIEVPFSLTDWLLAHKWEVGGTVLTILLIVLGILLYLRYRNRPQEEEKVVPKEAADLVALRKLKELESQQLWQSGKVKDFYVELSFILREYIGNRYQLHALEHTTEEIMLLAEKLPEVNKSLNKKLHQTLSLADMAKFAKQKPLGSENEEALKNTFSFVEETALKEELSEPDTAEVKKEQKEVES